MKFTVLTDDDFEKIIEAVSAATPGWYDDIMLAVDDLLRLKLDELREELTTKET